MLSAIAIALGIVFAALLSEDAATISAAALVMTGELGVAAAFTSALVGLWVGDVVVYFLARKTGAFPFIASWFSKRPSSTFPAGYRAMATLFFCRFVPGTRVASYVAAGSLGMPALRFAAVTLVSAAVWILLVFRGLDYLLEAVPTTVAFWGLLVMGAVLATFWLLLKSRAEMFRSLQLTLRRWSRWEFWPAWLFYIPVGLMCCWLGLRFRGFTLPALANPSQRNGGIIGESKAMVLTELARTAQAETAPTVAIAPDDLPVRVARFEIARRRMGVSFPVVLKPDMGQRGAGFAKIVDLRQAREYLSKVKSTVILQPYIAGPYEAGIFYYRFPDESRGRIFAITDKRFPAVVGDGLRTLQELVLADPRAALIAGTYLKRFGRSSGDVPEKGVSVKLVEAGNHCQGCIFLDGSHLLTPALEREIDRIAGTLPGFFIGRFDVRYRSPEELRQGREFTIIELNGATSEATNIYDPSNSLLNAYRTLYRQWELVYAIGAENRRRGHQPSSLLDLAKDWWRYQQVSRSYPAAD